MTIDEDERASWVKHRVDGYWRLGHVEERASIYTLIDDRGFERGHITIPQSLLDHLRQNTVSLHYTTSDDTTTLHKRIKYLTDELVAKDKRIAYLEEVMSGASELEILYYIDTAKAQMGQKPSGLYSAKLHKYAEAIRKVMDG